MALHDPDSSAKEKAMALKLGRQKKIQIIDGQQVEVLGGFEDDDEDDNFAGITDGGDADGGLDGGVEPDGGAENVMAVQGDDGQHYVVLEVIQLGDNADKNKKGGSTPKKTTAVDPVVAAMDTSEINDESTAEMVLPDDGMMASMQAKPDQAFPPPAARAPAPPASTKADVANCFGFSDDEVSYSFTIISGCYTIRICLTISVMIVRAE